MNVYFFDNTAKRSNNDYEATSPVVVTFHGGQTRVKPVDFVILEDNVVENLESIYAYVAKATHKNVQAIEPDLSLVYIEDNDGKIFLSLFYLIILNYLSLLPHTCTECHRLYANVDRFVTTILVCLVRLSHKTSLRFLDLDQVICIFENVITYDNILIA